MKYFVPSNPACCLPAAVNGRRISAVECLSS